MDTVSGATLSAILWLWAPRLVAAAFILLVAYLIGRALKTLIAKGAGRIPALARHDEGVEPRRSTGAQLGEVGYWLVLLIGIVAALNVLQLAQVAAPLNALLSRVMTFVPNVVGAGLIFFIGFIVATISRRLVTAALATLNLDKYLGKVGLAPASSVQTPAAQPSRLANAAGLVVFILILIPVSIAALQTLGIQAISTPAIAVLSTVFASIPNVLGAAIILALGFIIGRWVASVVESVLPATGIDRAIGAIGELTAKPGLQSPGAGSAPALPKVSPSKILANIVLFAILAFSAVEAARLLRFEAIALILTSVLTLMGKVVVGGAIIALGVLIADMLANLLKRSSGEENRFVASIVRWAAIALSVGMGLKFMGIADVIVVIAFGSILGSAAVAAALAFGLGAREAAGRLADSWVSRGIEKTKPEGARPTPAP